MYKLTIKAKKLGAKSRPYFLLLPLIFLTILILVGLINIILQSLGYIPAFGLNNVTFKYFLEIFKRDDFLDALFASLKISIIASVLAAILGTMLASALVYSLSTKSKKMYFIKIAILIPHSIVALFMIAILSRNGLLARLLYNLGMIASENDFPMLLYGKENFGIIIGYIWKEVPFVAYFTLSLIESVSQSLGEAAENLGASKIKSFFYITLPLSMPAILKAFLIVLSFSFGAYELPFLLGSTLPKALPVSAYNAYTHPDLLNRPYAMAMNVVILAVSWLFALFYYIVLKRRKYDA